MKRDYDSRKKGNCPIDGIYLVEFNIYEVTVSIIQIRQKYGLV